MRMNKAIFPCLFLSVIYISWIAYTPKKADGFTIAAPTPIFSITRFMNTDFQKEVDKYLPGRLPSLTFLLYLKNDLYELLNGGQFHSGYNKTIIQGKNGVLFEKSYLTCSFGYATVGEVRRLAQKTAEKLKVLKRLLQKHAVTPLLLMAPTKVDFYAKEAPWHYAPRYPQGFLGSAVIGPIYEQSMAKNGIEFVDCYPAMTGADNQDIVFTDRGIHWSMYGAALCLQKLAATLHELDPAKYATLDITGKKRVTEARYDEKDLANLLNIWPKYARGRDYFYLAEFRKISRPQPFTFIGDSFIGALIWNMELSGYSTRKMINGNGNQMPAREEFMGDLKHGGILILAGNATKFVQPYFDIHIQTLIDYLQER